MSTISAGTTSTTTLIHSGDTTGSLVLKTNDTGSGGTTAVTIDTSQNVGIGTSSPSQKLHVQSAGNTYLKIQDTQTNGYNAATLYANDQRTFRLGVLGTAGGFTNGALVVYDETAAAWRMVIDSSGRVLVGLTSANTSGSNFQVSQGVTFPATQSASSDANTLDDYEEGTWSAVVAGESGTITSYIVNSATYTKTGDTVYVYLRFNVVNKGTGSNFVVSGLPFTASRELLGIWAETNTTGLTGFMFNAGTGATSFTSRLAANWGGACLVNGNYTVEVTYKV